MTFLRRQLFGILGSTVAVAAGSQAACAEAGAPPVHMLVPCPVGSATDISAREIAQWWSENSDWKYEVVNIPRRTARVVEGLNIDAALGDVNTITVLFDLGSCDYDASVPE
jgi:hypothetical protein